MIQLDEVFTYLLLLCLCYYVNCENGRILRNVTVHQRNPYFDNMLLNGTIKQAVKKYQCILEDIPNDIELLLYGTKAWTFPMQDVNLTLRYPSENEEPTGHLITGVIVILYLDGTDNGGYIKTGGMMQDNISLTFILSGTSRLAYQFWLYGVHRSVYNMTLLYTRELC